MIRRNSVTDDTIRPRPERHTKKLLGYVRRSGHEVEAATFENVSENGCCIVGEFAIGEHLVVTVPTIGTVGAQVRWAIANSSGLKLHRAS